MKILFLSDIHGSVPALQTVLQFFDQHHFDLLVILGDLLNYGPRNGLPDGLDAPGVVDLLNERADKILAVRGNCDSEVDQMLLHFPIQGTYALLVDEGVKFFLTHGHIYNEQCLPQAPACDVFVYGHTHVMRLEAADEETHRPAILNPGSPTFPKGGNPPTFATWSSGKRAGHPYPRHPPLRILNDAQREVLIALKERRTTREGLTRRPPQKKKRQVLKARQIHEKDFFRGIGHALSTSFMPLPRARIYNKEYMRREKRQILTHRCLFVSY